MFGYRMWWRAGDSAEWEPGHRLLVRVGDGETVKPEQLSWSTADGALSTLGFAPDMSACYGHRAAGGDVVELRGELGDPPRDAGGRRYEFDAETDDGSAGRLRLLVDDGAETPLRWVAWRDRGGTCSVALRSAGPAGNADVTSLVREVWADAEHPGAGEVAANLVDGTRSKWFAPQDRASLEFEFPQPIAVDRYALTSANDADDRDPAVWILRGSVDGIRWRTLDSRAHQSFADRHQARTYRIAAPGSFTHYRLDILGTNGSPDVQLESVRFFADSTGFTGYRQRAGHDPVAYRGRRVEPESVGVAGESLPEELPARRLRRLSDCDTLRAGTELVSPSGRYALRYGPDGVPVVIERATHRFTWRAGDDDQHPAAGELRLSGGIQVELHSGGTWESSVCAADTGFLVVTDEGELELLDRLGVSVYNSGRGFVGPEPVFRDSAPVAEIALKRYLYRKDRKGAVAATVRRLPDGGLWATERNWSYPAADPSLARWLAQDGTVLTWRPLPGTTTGLCLVDDGGTPLWQANFPAVPTTPPPTEPHDHGGPAMGLGARLRLQSLTSPSGSHTLSHRSDGNLVLYCATSGGPVWTTGTDWLGASWVDLAPDGDLVLRTSCGAPVWRSGTADLGVARLAVRDDGSLVLLDAGGAVRWAVDGHALCTAPGRIPPRGAVLRRGQSLRHQSLTSSDGGTVLNHEPGHGVRLFGADGIQVWYADSGEDGAELALGEDGCLRVLDEDGAVLDHLAGPGDHLVVVPGGEIRLCAEDGTVVWREGHHVFDDPVTIGSRTVAPAALAALVNSPSTPIVRTDFSDPDAWETTWRDITEPREYWGDEVVLDATMITDPEFDGWTGEDLVSLLLSLVDDPDLVFVVDTAALTSPEHPVLVLEADPSHTRPRSFRATPDALVDVETQLSIGNMDWEDFSESVDSDGVLRVPTVD
ncbi:DUF6924 domain-containing protein [Amycolatopsis sp. CA-230715]|uniref:DUF6924 domain-containing protein n=1 Tax=Amycolatopsis sp. CA-230715 TaxID=2745196 RepID=UPI001C0233E6|nr:hypothetical protein [Amycolatopsis sp. CA-230715]